MNVALWGATLGAAALVAAAPEIFAAPVRELLGLALTPRLNPPPGVGRVLSLAAHNLPIAAWPLLLGTLGAQRLWRGVADALVAGTMLANVLPVGAALGAYGTRLLPYLPQLPLEWGALALGAGSWLTQRRRALSARESLTRLGLIASFLLCAAALEVAAVPHR